MAHRIGYTPTDYRAYLQMSHRRHMLVKDSREKFGAAMRLAELGAEIEQDYDIDIDDADFLINCDEPISNQDKVNYIYTIVANMPYTCKLVKFDDLDFNLGVSPEFISGSSQEAVVNSTTEIDKAIAQLISEGIIVPQPSEVSDYLHLNSDLLEVLPHITKAISEQFKTPTQLSLEIYSDPEVEDTYLTLYVRQQVYDANILDSIKAVREKFSRHLVGKSGWVHLTTDFDYPR
jgi:hypothetical protein